MICQMAILKFNPFMFGGSDFCLKLSHYYPYIIFFNRADKLLIAHIFLYSYFWINVQKHLIILINLIGTVIILNLLKLKTPKHRINK